MDDPPRHASRTKVASRGDAQVEVGPVERADSLEMQVVLPFGALSPDAFELLVYLLLTREHPEDRIFYYGKTGDLGRDIVHVTSGGPLLVQCKRYQVNVGLDAIRGELAKVCSNIYSGALAERPTAVTFYVSGDLTSPALDLLRTKGAWHAAAPKALEAYLKETPSASLLRFAAEWEPALESVSAATLTQRLRAHPDLRDQFFRLQKVVDAAPLEALTAQVQRGHAELLAAFRNINNPFEQIRAIVDHLEEEHPGLAIKAEIDGRGPVWRISAKPGAGPVGVGQLRFPATEAGARGRAKFEHMLDTGDGITLEPDECIWDPVVHVRTDSAGPLEVSQLRIQPHAPDVRLSVDLRCGDALLRSVSLSFERIGRKEAEIVLKLGEALLVHLVIRMSSLSSGSVQFRFASQTPERALRLSEFLLAASQHSMHVINAESEQAMFDLGGVEGSWDDAYLRGVRDLALMIARINAELGTKFLFPESAEEGLNHVQALALAIEKRGPVAILGSDVTLSEVSKLLVEDLIDDLRAGRGLTLQKKMNTLEVFGATLDVGSFTLTLDDLRPAKPLEELEALLANMGEDDVTDIEFAPARSIYSFDRWNDA